MERITSQAFSLLLVLNILAVFANAALSTPSGPSSEITVKNHCIERKATLENVDYLQGRIDRGEKLWQRTRKNLETARDGLRHHAEVLQEKISAEGADYRMVCQSTKEVGEPGNALADVEKDKEQR
ncbi:uncharacterized protein LOC111262711 [Varroa jacobsoni]|uniref:Uncharacterized protein n=1 Tax=Varroa destructor TaxID=109461 RepID=A0A7M7KW48_VARDE|nr:uncharacterized protein LOC111254671 [Varroa destructor]XP_022692924.1 uncharacterized protein LOC111262711 [Varroa jacobsoni]